MSRLRTPAALLAAAALLAVLCAASAAAQQCPPPGFDSVANFSVEKYIAAPWYVQEQVPVSYQTVNDLFCVRARYTPLDGSNPAKGLLVNNYANRGRVNGPAMGTSDSSGAIVRLVAMPAEPGSSSPTAASKLLVGPAALQAAAPRRWRDLYGPYWVVAVGESNNATLGYDWAIVTGGAPETPSNGACRTGRAGLRAGRQVNDDGFWLFSRKPVDPEAAAAAREKAKALGLDVSQLRKVQQEGCAYAGAV